MSVDQNISTLPTAPSRSDAPSEFSDKADAFVGALQPLPNQLNTYATQVNAAESTVEELHELAAAGAAILNATEWQSGTTYAEFDAVIGSDAQTYRSLTDANAGNDPVTDDGSNWALVGAEPVALVLKPEPVSPADNATDIGETPTLDGGTYYSLYGKTHAISRFQVASDVGFTTIVYDSGEISATETHDVPSGNLLESTNYYWRVYYEDEDGVESEFSDTFEFTTSATFFDPEDPANIGSAYAGGFLVGIIDTVAGTIDGQDDYQTGERYALVVSPKSLEDATDPSWDSQNRTGESGSFTRWDGLSSTDNILAKNDTSYEAFEHIRSIRSSNPVPSDGGSDWYLPAMDELELIYRNLKPDTDSNKTISETSLFPGTQSPGFNPSSDPTGSAYTAGDPSQTSVMDFQDGGAEAVDLDQYWSSTDGNEASRAWFHGFTTPFSGEQNRTSKDLTSYSVRPVRRVPL